MKCEHVSVSIGGKQLLSDISFSLSPGTVTALVGRNGAGKTTLLRTLAGLLSYTGFILMKEGEISHLSPAQRAKAVSLVAQNPVKPSVPLLQYVSFGRYPYYSLFSGCTQKDHTLLRDCLSRFALTELSDRLISSLSGGEFQRAQFALVCAQDTEVVLLDEPASHLDSDGIRLFVSFVSDLRNAGKIVLCVLHDVSLAMSISDSLILMEQGRLIMTGTPSDFARSGTLEKYLRVERLVGEAQNGCKTLIYRPIME